MAADSDKVILDAVEDSQTLLNGAAPQQFLKEVVAVLIDHDLRQLLTDLLKKEFDQDRVRFRKKVLQVL